MKAFRKLLFLSALLPLLSIGSAYGTDVAERGGGGMRGGGVRDNAGFNNRGDELRRDGAYRNLDAVEGGYVNPGYGYPVGGYLQNTNAFPDDAEADSIYKANQHPGE
ncbi:MAG TPA: hypothetical protein VGP47_00670 [Parachlamydiaceae bacterium]|nr:hypothetical protein [Parachlamydiaceae bacterium]